MLVTSKIALPEFPPKLLFFLWLTQLDGPMASSCPVALQDVNEDLFGLNTSLCLFSSQS